ncbi:MAG: PAS domain S-box protein [Nitrospira sp.]|nr:PAS domain S-box protein [Nitrospira sp.]
MAMVWFGVSMFLKQEITERKLAEEAAQKSEARLKLQIERMPIGCIIWSPDFRVMTWNPAAEKIFGFKAEEMLGKHPYDLIVPKDAQPHVDTIWRRLLEGDTTAYSVNENTTKDGRVITCDWSNTPLKDDGTVIGVLSMVQDITERKQAEEKLALERNRFVTASLAGRVALWVWDLRSGELEWSDIVDSMLGYEAGEFPRTIQAWEELIHPDDRPHVMQMLERHLEQGTPYDTEYRVRTKEGSYIWWRDTGTCQRDEHGKAYQMSGACADITVRKRAEEELKKYHEHLEEMVRERTADLEQASEALRQSERELSIRNRIANIFLTATTDEEIYNDVLNVILEFMESKYGVIGYIDEDGAFVVPSMSRHIWDKCQVPDKSYVFPRDKWGYSSWPRAIREKKTNYTNKVSTLTPKGHIAVSKHISMPIIYQGEVIGLIQIANKETDYTDKDVKLLESLGSIIAPILNARLQRDREEQERKKAEKALHVALDNLKQRTAQLEAANRELEAFSYSVSHDLRAPLRAIDGFSNILLEDYQNRLDEEGKRVLNTIRNSTKQMGQLIDDLLAFSRISRQEVAKSEIDMTRLAKAVFEELKPSIPEQTSQFNLKELPPAQGDQSMIRQVFMNLLSNAIKFTGKKESAVIEVAGWSEENENVYCVKDNGAGFDMQYKNKLFGIFQRLHSAQEFEGTGVGLAIVQRVIHKHGGRVWAEGKVNEGATFYFTLPNILTPLWQRGEGEIL